MPLPHPFLVFILLTLHRVLRLTQRRHDIDAISLASEFLNRRVLIEVSTTHYSLSSVKVVTYIKSHENIVFLPYSSVAIHIQVIPVATYLLITNSELALRLLVLVGESLELLDRLRLQDLDAEFDVALGVLVAGLEGLLARVGSCHER
jgi:hypothetical protein